MATIAERLRLITAVEADRAELDRALGRDYVRRQAGLPAESAVDRALREANVMTCRGHVPVSRGEPFLGSYCERRPTPARCPRSRRPIPACRRST